MAGPRRRRGRARQAKDADDDNDDSVDASGREVFSRAELAMQAKEAGEVGEADEETDGAQRNLGRFLARFHPVTIWTGTIQPSIEYLMDVLDFLRNLSFVRWVIGHAVFLSLAGIISLIVVLAYFVGFLSVIFGLTTATIYPIHCGMVLTCDLVGPGIAVFAALLSYPNPCTWLYDETNALEQRKQARISEIANSDPTPALKGAFESSDSLEDFTQISEEVAKIVIKLIHEVETNPDHFIYPHLHLEHLEIILDLAENTDPMIDFTQSGTDALDSYGILMFHTFEEGGKLFNESQARSALAKWVSHNFWKMFPSMYKDTRECRYIDRWLRYTNHSMKEVDQIIVLAEDALRYLDRKRKSLRKECSVLEDEMTKWSFICGGTVKTEYGWIGFPKTSTWRQLRADLPAFCYFPPEARLKTVEEVLAVIERFRDITQNMYLFYQDARQQFVRLGSNLEQGNNLTEGALFGYMGYTTSLLRIDDVWHIAKRQQESVRMVTEYVERQKRERLYRRANEFGYKHGKKGRSKSQGPQITVKRASGKSGTHTT